MRRAKVKDMRKKKARRAHPGKEDGAQKLRSVLIAYARRDPRVGYVQGMGFVAALLLVFVDILAPHSYTVLATVGLVFYILFYIIHTIIKY